MMTTMNNNSDESATLLQENNSSNATINGRWRFKTYAMIGAAATLGAFGVLHAAQKSSSLTMGSGVRRARLGAGGPQTVTLHTGCSPLNKLPFDASGDWTGAIGAKVVSKSMSSDFRYEAALDMVETSCGNYEATVDLAVGEEFGFYLHPIGDDSDVNTALDNGCLHEGDARCPAFSSPSALAGIETCTSKYEDPGSGDVFYNRVFDGTTLSFNWGTCETTCAADGPPGCPATSTAPALPLDAATCPISSGTGDAGYADNYRGWYDASGCGICQDYCRWVGNSGSGGNPSVKTSHGDSFWSCRKAGGKSFNPGTNQKDFCPDPSNTNIRNVGGCGSDNYSARGYYGDTFTLEKCSGQGAAAPGFSQTSTAPELSKFETTGTFAYTAPQTGMAKVLVVGGGGGGGGRSGAGGGGGGVVYVESYPVVAGQTYTIKVGAGGAGGSGIVNSGKNTAGNTDDDPGKAGEDSQFDNLIALGGGGGGSSWHEGGYDGGSGGGGKYGHDGGDALQTSQSGLSGQYGHGYAGGKGTSGTWNAGGGGGAGSIGESGTSSHCGNGGDGFASEITGAVVLYGGGGGGGSHNPACSSGGEGGSGGGGKNGMPGAKDSGTDGTNGLGGGGGGGSTTSHHGGNGGNGGSGTVVVSCCSPPADNVAVAATGSKYWKVSNADPLGWRPKVKNFGLYSDAACTQLISEAESELICSGEVSSRPCSNAATGKLPPLTPAERSIVNCDNSATSKGCRYSQENVGEEAVSWRPSDPSPSEDAVWIGSKFTNPVDVKCAVSTGLGNVFNNGVDGVGFGGTSQGGKHRITLWKSDDGVQWEEVATSDGTNADDVVVVQ